MALARSARLIALASAYFESTGLKPEECKLVERQLNVKGQFIIEWHFVKRDQQTPGAQVTCETELACPGAPLSAENPERGNPSAQEMEESLKKG